MKKILHSLNTWVFLLVMALVTFVQSFQVKESRNYHLKNMAGFATVILGIATLDFIFDTYFLEGTGLTLAMAPLVNLTKTSICNLAGVSTIYYVIPTEDIETFPTFGATTEPADTAQYLGDFGLAAGKFWYEFYSTKEMGELLSETDGATDGKFFRNSFTGFYPRYNADSLGLANVLKDTDCIVIAKEVSGNKYHYVIGNEDIPVTVSPSGTTGKAYSDEKGITFLFEAASCRMPVIYSGEIITETGAVQSPTTMAIDATSIDLAINKRFEVGANTGAIVLATIENMVPGDKFRIDFVATSTGSLAFSGAFGATALIDTDGEWFQVVKDENNSLVIEKGNFS